MPNTPRPPTSAYVYLAWAGTALIGLGTTGLIVQRLSWGHGLTFLGGFMTAILVLTTLGRPVIRRVARRRVERAAREAGISVTIGVTGRGHAPSFDFDPESFHETRQTTRKPAGSQRLLIAFMSSQADSAAATPARAPSDPDLDANIERLKRLVEHPTTPEHERAAAAQQLAKLITKRSKRDGRA